MPSFQRHAALLLILLIASRAKAFQKDRTWQSYRSHCLTTSSRLEEKRSYPSDKNQQQQETNLEEEQQQRLENGIDKTLLPPAINLRKESILFGDNPATRYDSLRAWRATKKHLPFVLHGARHATTADENPIGGFYNMIFVRLPTILAGCVYAKNALTGHPLVIDVGSGPTEVSPLIVAAVFFVILR